MNFPNPTPFEDIKKYIEQSTQDEQAGLATGLPIYVDPEGLKEAEAKMTSTITLNLEGVPLRTTLRLAVRQLGLDYRVDGGLILISDQGTIVMQEMKAMRAKQTGHAGSPLEGGSLLPLQSVKGREQPGRWARPPRIRAIFARGGWKNGSRRDRTRATRRAGTSASRSG